jgi:drug/metabolite transporter (DMT)-like permease
MAEKSLFYWHQSGPKKEQRGESKLKEPGYYVLELEARVNNEPFFYQKVPFQCFPPLVATAYASLFGTLLLLPAAALEGSLLTGVHRLTVYGWVSVLQLALLGTVAGFVWWYEGVEMLGASRASAFVNLVPLFGVLLSALILSESLEVPQLAGGILVVVGVGIGTLGNPENG